MPSEGIQELGIFLMLCLQQRQWSRSGVREKSHKDRKEVIFRVASQPIVMGLLLSYLYYDQLMKVLLSVQKQEGSPRQIPRSKQEDALLRMF